MLYIKKKNLIIPVKSNDLFLKCSICGSYIKYDDLDTKIKNFYSLPDIMNNEIQLCCKQCSSYLNEEHPKEMVTDHDRIVVLVHNIDKYKQATGEGI